MELLETEVACFFRYLAALVSTDFVCKQERLQLSELVGT